MNGTWLWEQLAKIAIGALAVALVGAFVWWVL